MLTEIDRASYVMLRQGIVSCFALQLIIGL